VAVRLCYIGSSLLSDDKLRSLLKVADYGGDPLTLVCSSTSRLVAWRAVRGSCCDVLKVMMHGVLAILNGALGAANLGVVYELITDELRAVAQPSS